MAMTDPQLYEIARKLANDVFVKPNSLAHSNLDQLKAAVGQIDTAMNATTNQVQVAYPNAVLKLAMLDFAKQGAPNLTNQEAAIALAYWALKEVGIL